MAALECKLTNDGQRNCVIGLLIQKLQNKVLEFHKHGFAFQKKTFFIFLIDKVLYYLK